MITQENIEINGKQYVRTCSDMYFVLQNETGIEYVDALDIFPSQYTYSETEHKLPETINLLPE